MRRDYTVKGCLSIVLFWGLLILFYVLWKSRAWQCFFQLGYYSLQDYRSVCAERGYGARLWIGEVRYVQLRS